MMLYGKRYNYHRDDSVYCVTSLCSSQVREQFINDPAFESITEEQERVRIFKEFRKTIKASNNCCVNTKFTKATCLFLNIFSTKLL